MGSKIAFRIMLSDLQMSSSSMNFEFTIMIFSEYSNK